MAKLILRSYVSTHNDLSQLEVAITPTPVDFGRNFNQPRELLERLPGVLGVMTLDEAGWICVTLKNRQQLLNNRVMVVMILRDYLGPNHEVVWD